MKYNILHRTSYEYADLTPVCHNLVHLAPRDTRLQKCAKFELVIEPLPAFRARRTDAFGNRADYFSVESAHRQLEIVAESVVDIQSPDSQLDHMVVRWEDCVIKPPNPRSNGSPLRVVEPVQWQMTFPSPRVPLLSELREYAGPSFPPRQSIILAIVDLAARIHNDFQFDPRATTVDTPLAEVLSLRRGVCQDLAHLATGCVRAMGLAARYTSGYLRTTPPPGRPRLIGADASHAWCSVWCGPLGWVDFDPTNNCLAGDAYVTIAWGRDYGDVCPIQGVFVGQGEHHIRVSVDVAPETGE
jgi:transglutaminase-like putative cysteine protease